MALLIISIPLLLLGVTIAVTPLVLAARRDLRRGRAPLEVAPAVTALERRGG